MNEAHVELEHPVLFVLDSTSGDVQIPEYGPDITVSANASALSVKAICYLDGSVRVHLGTQIPSDALERLSVAFRGIIDVPSKTISVVTSEHEQILELELDAGQANVVVAVDDVRFPAEIWISASVI